MDEYTRQVGMLSGSDSGIISLYFWELILIEKMLELLLSNWKYGILIYMQNNRKYKITILTII